MAASESKLERVRVLLWGRMKEPGGPTPSGLESTAPAKQEKYVYIYKWNSLACHVRFRD